MRRNKWPFAAAAALVLAAAGPAVAQPGANPLGLDLAGAARAMANPGNASTTLTVVFLVTIISLAPAILVMTTSFTRIIVVLGFLRQAMGTQQTPPNQVLIGLALFLTFFIMAPTYQRMNAEALQPYLKNEIAQTEALEKALAPMREFMFRQTRPGDLRLIGRASCRERV